MTKPTEETPFQKWYAANKKNLNAKRKERYHADAEYRERAKTQANKSRKRVAPETAPDSHPYSFEDVAEALGITQYSLRDWRRRGYFPEPFRQNSRLYFSDDQLSLLHQLKAFLEKGGGRKEMELETMKNVMFMNWGED